MMHRARWLLFVSFLATSIFVLANCGMPGTVLGIYSVNGVIQTNTCGAGLEAPSPWAFNVELSQQTTTLYWNTMDGSPLLSGPVISSAVTMDDSTGGNVDSTLDGAPGPCDMTRNDVLTLSLTGSPVTSFTGSLTYSFAVASGADCSDQLSAAGGIYDTLPCTVSYTLSGAHQ